MIPRRMPRFYKGEVGDIFRMIFQKRVGRGDYVKAFEKEFARYVGVRFAIVTCSGRSAMELLLDSLGLKKGDEVILPGYTLADLVKMIENKGLAPKFVDVEEESFNINPGLIESQITDKTKVIIATHIFGLPCNIKRITGIANKYKIPVLEDCAHSAGAVVEGTKTGAFGKAGFFSLETTKLINTFGGGVITTNDERINAYIRERIKNYPVYPGRVLQKIALSCIEHFVIVSPLYKFVNLLFMFKPTAKAISRLYLLSHSKARVGKSRLTNLQALLGLRQLKDLDERNSLRNQSARRLNQALNGIVLSQRNDIGANRVYYFYTVSLKQADNLEAIRRKLLFAGVDAGIKAEITDNCILFQKLNSLIFPVVNRVFSKVMQLPMYDSLKQKDIDDIACKLKRILAGNGKI